MSKQPAEIFISDQEVIVKRAVTINPLGSVAPDACQLDTKLKTRVHGIFLHEKVKVLPGEYNGWDTDDEYFNTTFLGVLNQEGQAMSLDGNKAGSARSLHEQIEAYRQEGVPIVDLSNVDHSLRASRTLLEDNELLTTDRLELELARLTVGTTIVKLWLASRDNL